MDGANFVEDQMASRDGYVVAKVLSIIRPFFCGLKNHFMLMYFNVHKDVDMAFTLINEKNLKECYFVSKTRVK